MNILALEPYHGKTRRSFLDGLVRHSRHHVHPVTMSRRYWEWRLQGGAVTLARKALQAWEEGVRPDLILATDMVNLPAFLALTRTRLAGVPVVLYLHENRLTYPLQPGKSRDVSYGYINYLSALCADRVVFNTRFHRTEFFEALPELLRSYPDYTHLQTAQQLQEQSSVLHPGLDLKAHDAYAGEYTQHRWGPGMEPPIVLWTQRWQYDKNPEAFFRLMNRLNDAGCQFRLILAGEHFEEQPYEFEQAWRRYANRILHYGYTENFEEYSRLLHRADLVVSTAAHEFFGVAVQEAIYCGCHPLLPERLSYPELVPEALHHPLLHAPVLYRDEDHLFRIMHDVLKGEERPLPVPTLRQIPAALDWSTQAEAFDRLFEEVGEAASLG